MKINLGVLYEEKINLRKMFEKGEINWEAIVVEKCWHADISKGKPGVLKSKGSQTVEHDWVTEQQQSFIVFLPFLFLDLKN